MISGAQNTSVFEGFIIFILSVYPKYRLFYEVMLLIIRIVSKL